MTLAMRLERERFLAAGHDERVPERRGHANGSKPEPIDTPAGTLNSTVPKTAGTDEPYYPQALDRSPLCGPTFMPCGHAGRGRQVCMRCLDPRRRAGDGAIRLVEPVIAAGRPAAEWLDDEREAWRCRRLGESRHLFPDASSREGMPGRCRA